MKEPPLSLRKSLIYHSTHLELFDPSSLSLALLLLLDASPLGPECAIIWNGLQTWQHCSLKGFPKHRARAVWKEEKWLQEQDTFGGHHISQGLLSCRRYKAILYSGAENMFSPFSANWDLTESAVGTFCSFSWPDSIPGGPARGELVFGQVFD